MENLEQQLYFAAKAAGYINYTYFPGKSLFIETGTRRGDNGYWWTPIDRDADAFRLAVKLQMDVSNDHPKCCIVTHSDLPKDVYIIEYYKDHEGNMYAATRMAIFKAAVEIGRRMK